MSMLLTLAAEGEGAHLPMSPLAFGLVALLVFFLLLFVVWMFRHTTQTMIEGGHHGGPAHDAGHRAGHGGAHH